MKSRPYPQGVQGIKVGRKCARFHFLHATTWSVNDGVVVGTYVVHYADDTSQSLKIVYGKDLRDWWVGTDNAVELKSAQVAWQGQTSNGDAVRIYSRTWENPLPDREVDTIDFISTMTQCAPFLLALTVE